MSSVVYKYDGNKDKSKEDLNTVPRSSGGSAFDANEFNESFTATGQCGTYNKDSFHDAQCNGNINNYNNRFEVQTCRLVSLSDLKHEDQNVQNIIACFLNRLIDYGVVGFRIDASRHIAAKNLGEIIQKLKYLKSDVNFLACFKVIKFLYLVFWLKKTTIYMS